MNRPRIAAAHPATIIKVHVGAGDSGAARADTLKNLERFGGVLFPYLRVAPRIVHDDDAAGLHVTLRISSKTNRPDACPFFASIDHDDVEAFIRNRVKILGAFKSHRILEIERT